MNENIRLVIKILFFNVGLPVLSVSPGTSGNNPDLTDVQLKSNIEYVSEYGDVLVKRAISPKKFSIKISEAPDSYDDPWISEFEMEELLTDDKSSRLAKIKQATKSMDLFSGLTPMSSPLTKITGRSEGIEEPEDDKKDALDKPQESLQDDPVQYDIKLSKSNYILFKILNLFGIEKASLNYEYTELDYIPLAIQVLLHIPLILTGLIIFIVVMTLDPELNANLVKNEIEKLPSAIYTKDMSLPNCPVCLDEFIEDQEVRILSCRHGFHKECIDAWLVHTLKCPICRKSVSSLSSAPQFDIYQTYHYV